MLYASSILMSGILLQSCLDDHDDSIDHLLRPTALVTVIPSADESFIMQLDNATALKPINMAKSPFGKKEVRALVNYSEDGNELSAVRNVSINWIDSIRTKLPVPSLDDESANDLRYGNDPIDIVNDWVTIAEDGYLTLRVRTLWGSMSRPHSINLLADPDDPYKFELRHDAHGDISGTMGDALIAFNLNHLPQPADGNIRIELEWISFNGHKSTEFDLQLRSDQTDMAISNDDIVHSRYVK